MITKLAVTIIAFSLILGATESSGKVEQTFSPVSPKMLAMIGSKPVVANTVASDPECDPCQSCQTMWDAAMCAIGWNYTCFVACPICPQEGGIRAALKALPVRAISPLLPDAEYRN